MTSLFEHSCALAAAPPRREMHPKITRRTAGSRQPAGDRSLTLSYQILALPRLHTGACAPPRSRGAATAGRSAPPGSRGGSTWRSHGNPGYHCPSPGGRAVARASGRRSYAGACGQQTDTAATRDTMWWAGVGHEPQAGLQLDAADNLPVKLCLVLLGFQGRRALTRRRALPHAGSRVNSLWAATPIAPTLRAATALPPAIRCTRAPRDAASLPLRPGPCSGDLSSFDD